MCLCVSFGPPCLLQHVVFYLQCVVLTDAPLALQLKINQFCRAQNPPIKVSADCYIGSTIPDQAQCVPTTETVIPVHCSKCRNIDCAPVQFPVLCIN